MRYGNNTYAVNQGLIQTVGDRAHGMVAYAPGSYANNASGGTIATNGDSTTGIYYNAVALNNQDFKWNLGNIVINGTNSFGIATPQSFFRNDGIITINGSSSYGMLAGGSYNLVVDPAITSNTYLGGLTQLSAAQGGSTALNIQAINAYNGSTALLARANSYLENKGTITANDTGSIGILLQQSHGINEGFVTATNTTSVEVYTGNFENTGTINSNILGILGNNGATISQKGIINSTGNAVQFQTGNNSLELLSGSITRGAIVMGIGEDITKVSGLANIDEVPLFNGTSNLSTLIFDNHIGPVHQFQSWGLVTITNGSRIILDSGPVHSAASINVDVRSVLGFASTTGYITGNITNTGVLDFSDGMGIGNYLLEGDVINSGVIALANAVPIQNSRVTINGNYTGANGLLSLNTYLSGDNSPSDLLVISGGHADGTTGIFIHNTTDAGDVTLKNGIKIVNAINGATTNGNAFYLVDPAVSGPFEYNLYRSAIDGTDADSWYLRSLCPPGNPKCSIEPPGPVPDPPGPVPPGPEPEYRTEVGLYPVLPATALLYGEMV